MKFRRIYVELTNACGLHCTFCPSGGAASRHMSLAFFESVIEQASAYTREIACHVVGDPLMRPDLAAYLDIIHDRGLRAVLTTSGYFVRKHAYDTLFHPCVKQLNLSINAFNKNNTGWSFDQYLDPVLDLCREKLEKGSEAFINFRVWNLDEAQSERAFNATLFSKLARAFCVSLDIDRVYAQRPKSIRLADKILLHFDEYFEWPSLDNPVYGDGRCLGLASHVAILSDGKVVPCCLDCDGVITLGDLHADTLADILRSERARNMKDGFRQGRAVEALCQKCSYKDRFIDDEAAP